MLRPLYNRIVVRAAKEQERTSGGLFLPDTVKDRPSRGTVVAVGPGEIRPDGTLRPLNAVAVGDEVLYSKYGKTGIRDEATGEELVVIDNKCILAIMARASG